MIDRAGQPVGRQSSLGTCKPRMASRSARIAHQNSAAIHCNSAIPDGDQATIDRVQRPVNRAASPITCRSGLVTCNSGLVTGNSGLVTGNAGPLTGNSGLADRASTLGGENSNTVDRTTTIADQRSEVIGCSPGVLAESRTTLIRAVELPGFNTSRDAFTAAFAHSASPPGTFMAATRFFQRHLGQFPAVRGDFTASLASFIAPRALLIVTLLHFL
jgi:hypothetical protein